MARRSLSIRIHLAIFGALILLPLIAAALVVAALYAGDSNEDDGALEAQGRQVVAGAATAVDGALDRYRLALQVLASSSLLSEGKLESLYLRAQALSEPIPGTFIALRRADGETLFLTNQPFGESGPLAGDAGLRAADRLAIDYRSPVITDLVTDPANGKFVALEVPVLEDGKAAYLLTLALSQKSVLDILAAQPATPGWTLAVFDNKENVITRSDGAGAFSGDKATPAFARGSQDKSGSFVDSADGAPMLTVYRRSDLSGWKVAAAAAAPVTTTQVPPYEALRTPAIIAGIGLLGSLILAIFYGRLMSRPLRQLRAAAGERPDEKPVYSGISELDGVFGILTRSLVALKDRDRARARTANEVNQRMRNMIEIVQAIAQETRKRAPSLEQFGRTFESRLQALAKSHEALGHSDWHSGDLGTLIAETCKPFAAETQLALDGPAIELPRKTAIDMGIAIHELASNAAKHGALRVPEGKVKVHWDLLEEGGLKVLRLQWQEQDGPTLIGVSREGFGTVLLGAIIETDLGGKLDMMFGRDGLHCIVCIPLSALTGPSLVPEDDENEKAGARR